MKRILILSLLLAVTVQAREATLMLHHGRRRAVDAVPRDGLVVWQRGENNALDSSPNEYNGEWDGNESYTEGQVGQAFAMDGASWIDLPGDASEDALPYPSISAWVKLDTLEGTQTIMESTASIGAGNTRRFALYIHNGAVRLDVAMGDLISGDDLLFGDTTLTVGVWHHVAGTFDGSHLRVFLDGEPDGEGEKATLPNTDDGKIAIGRRSLNHDRYFSGLVDEFLIYDRALESAEIVKLANPNNYPQP